MIKTYSIAQDIADAQTRDRLRAYLFRNLALKEMKTPTQAELEDAVRRGRHEAAVETQLKAYAAQ